MGKTETIDLRIHWQTKIPKHNAGINSEYKNNATRAGQNVQKEIRKEFRQQIQ